MIATRQLVMEWGLNGRLTKCRYCRYSATKGRCHGNHFCLSLYRGVHWRHLVNMTKLFVCSGDAALCQITTSYLFVLRWSWYGNSVAYL